MGRILSTVKCSLTCTMWDFTFQCACIKTREPFEDSLWDQSEMNCWWEMNRLSVEEDSCNITLCDGSQHTKKWWSRVWQTSVPSGLDKPQQEVSDTKQPILAETELLHTERKVKGWVLVTVKYLIMEKTTFARRNDACGRAKISYKLQ